MSEQSIVAIVLGLITLAGTSAAALFVFLGTRGKTRAEAAASEVAAAQADMAARFDDASELAKYIREEVERQVEIQVAPIRDKLKAVESESHEMNVAVRARETQLWLWDHLGRQGALPMLPKPILDRLDLIHLTATEVAPTPKEGMT